MSLAPTQARWTWSMPWRTTWPLPAPSLRPRQWSSADAPPAPRSARTRWLRCALVVRVPERVRAAPPAALVRTPFGTMTLEGYLPTRTFELTVHTCDLAAALGVSADVQQAAAADAFAIIGALAAVQGTASTALLALTGRLRLPAGYSVL